jgi:hypothetical protein
MVDERGRDELTEEHEEHGVADAEGGRDPGDREHVEGDEQPREEQVSGLARQRAERPGAGEEQRRPGREEGHHEEHRRRRGGRADVGAEPRVERRQQRDAETGREHDEGLGGHGISLSHEHTPPRSAPSQGRTSSTLSARARIGVTGMTCPISAASRAVRAPPGSTARQQTYSSTRDACTS